MLNLQKLALEHDVQPYGVIHVGAHEGQEAADYAAMGVKQVLFIEANPTVFQRLQANLTNYPQMQAVNCAISDRNAPVNLHLTSMDQSSSILPLKLHQQVYPDITETAQIVVASKTLDVLLQDLDLNPGDFNWLNLDIQGAELLALKGAENLLSYVDAINTEVNFTELYADCALIDQIDDFLRQRGFERVAVTTPFHPSWGDAFYVRQPTIAMSTLGSNGRFGNQFFQYAFLKLYAQEHNFHVETPNWIGQILFGHRDRPLSSKLPMVVEETNQLEQAQIPYTTPPYKHVDFWGYFQFHTRYYAPYKNELRSLFEPVPEIATVVNAALNRLQAKGRTLVGLHLRRGDFGGSAFPIAPTTWYREWLRGFWESLEDPVLFIASDEPEKVLQDFADYHPVTLADLEVQLPQAEFYPDFYLLSQCDAVAISNSSFSHAACLLNQRGKFFFRPHFPTAKLIPFDPWHSEIWPQGTNATETIRETLIQVRQHLTELWLQLPPPELEQVYLQQKGGWQWIIQHSSLHENPLSSQQQELLDRARAALATDEPEAWRWLLVLILYLPPEKLPPMSLADVPRWLKAEFSHYLAYSIRQRNLSQGVLSRDLRLREINLIIFPDWSQPEETLTQALGGVLQTIAHHPQSNEITLLMAIGSGHAPTIDGLVSSLVMEMLLQEDWNEPTVEITLIGNLNSERWRALLSLLAGRIILPDEKFAVPHPSLLTALPELAIEDLAARRFATRWDHKRD
uniref:Methyltransferase FkbM family n=1 Tax=Cyanothece sp. (strain PCC 7425 / ATCC 29141) TaxID=395961 RepID=B8HU12_CYAP4